MPNPLKIQIVNVFSIFLEKEAQPVEDQEHKWLSQRKPNFSDCDEDILLSTCLKMETHEPNSEAKLNLYTNENTINANSTEPSSSSGLPDNENDKVISQPLDLRLQINRSIQEDIEEQKPNVDDSITEVQYKIVDVKPHKRKIKQGPRKKSVGSSVKRSRQ